MNETSQGEGTNVGATDEAKGGNGDDATPVTPAAQTPNTDKPLTPFRSVELAEGLDNSECQHFVYACVCECVCARACMGVCVYVVTDIHFEFVASEVLGRYRAFSGVGGGRCFFCFCLFGFCCCCFICVCTLASVCARIVESGF